MKNAKTKMKDPIIRQTIIPIQSKGQSAKQNSIATWSHISNTNLFVFSRRIWTV